MNSLKVISIDGEEFQMTEDEILTVMSEYIKKKREWSKKVDSLIKAGKGSMVNEIKVPTIKGHSVGKNWNIQIRSIKE
ncbi:hypothetical protein [Ligilactobacillus salivarius]|uniref:hypothetical protein n=1 Tax=Ligilactobacillus salivarius TaxID=1624 RepID=UPI003F89059C